MKLTNLIFIFCLLINVNSHGQIDTAEIVDNVYEQGILMSNAFHNGDYDKFLDLTHPKIVELSGGRTKMKSMFKQGMDIDLEFIKVDLEKPNEIFITDSIIQCALEQRQELKISGNDYYTIGSVIGISYNLGGKWYFIGVVNNTLDKLKIYFPELNDKLKIKPQTEPIIMEK